MPVAQLDRASASEAEGRRFDSCRARFDSLRSLTAGDGTLSLSKGRARHFAPGGCYVAQAAAFDGKGAIPSPAVARGEMSYSQRPSKGEGGRSLCPSRRVSSPT